MPDNEPPLSRDEFPVTARWAYLNHAGMGAVPHSAVQTMSRLAMEVARDGELAWPGHKAHVEQVRHRAARLMGVPSTDVAFIKNTTAGVGMVANGLDLVAGDRVIVSDLDFPSSLYPWLALRERGVRVDLVRPQGSAEALPVDAFAEVIADGPPPAVVAVSWVQFRRGWRIDLPALARVVHDAGALFSVDVIQGLGAIPAELETWGVDFAMADGHKWLLGPPGAGLLYVRGEHQHRLRPLEPGWNSMSHREEWDNLGYVLDRSARRYEGGMPNLSGIAALGASLDLLLDAGVPAIWRHVDALCQRASHGLRRLGVTVITDQAPNHRSGILSAVVPDHDSTELRDRLRSHGIVVGARSSSLRISPHGYNTHEEIDRLLAAVSGLSRP